MSHPHLGGSDYTGVGGLCVKAIMVDMEASGGLPNMALQPTTIGLRPLVAAERSR